MIIAAPVLPVARLTGESAPFMSRAANVHSLFPALSSDELDFALRGGLLQLKTSLWL
jgi:ABC-type phosphate transport system permease subunit